jgi:signal transduction histidine kinase
VIQAQADLAVCVERERHFTDDVAHELRTPLAGMRATIDVALRADRESDELRESLEDCSSILGKMESRVDKMLRLARLDGERVVFNKETIGLSELIDDCWEPLQGRAATRGLTFENRVPSELTCISDRGSLAIVFSNLLENGVQYADANERIWVTADESPEGAVRVAVANTGCSLGVADVPLAFRQFWRGDAGGDCHERHAGLGLPLVRRLAAALGGEASGDVDEDGVFTVCIVLNGSSTP